MKISNLKDKLITCIIFSVIIAAYILFKVPCLFLYLFDVHCPGCGMTRAFINVLRLDFYNAFYMHPMIFAMPLVLVYYFADWRLFKQKWLNDGILAIILIGFLVNWIVKFFY